MERPRIASIVATSFLWYFLTFLALEFTAPLTSKGDGIVFGIPLGICLLLFGAQRMTREGVRPGICFVYGCGSTSLFLFRFLFHMGGTGNFGLWLEYQQIITVELIVMWIGISLFLGAICAGVSKISAAGYDAGSLNLEVASKDSPHRL